MGRNTPTRTEKVLFLMGNMEGGGAQQVLVHLLNFLQEKGWRPRLFLVSKSGPTLAYLDPQVRVSYLHREGLNPFLDGVYRAWGYVLNRSSRLYRLAFFRSRYRVAVFSIQGLAYLAPCVRADKKVLWIHNNFHHFDKRTQDNLRRYAGYFDRVVCVSESNRQSLLEGIPALALRVRVAPNPHSIARIRQRALEPAHLPVDRPYLVSVGSLSSKKGFDLLIQAMQQVNVHCPELRLYIAGEGGDRESLQGLIEKAGLCQRVFLPGYLENPYPLIRHSLFYVLSSRFEGLPGVLIEALALGKAVVSTKSDGSREILRDGVHGILVDTESSRSLAGGILRMYRDEALRRDFERRAPERAMAYDYASTVPVLIRHALYSESTQP